MRIAGPNTRFPCATRVIGSGCSDLPCAETGRRRHCRFVANRAVRDWLLLSCLVEPEQEPTLARARPRGASACVGCGSTTAVSGALHRLFGGRLMAAKRSGSWYEFCEPAGTRKRRVDLRGERDKDPVDVIRGVVYVGRDTEPAGPFSGVDAGSVEALKRPSDGVRTLRFQEHER
jgi:hypothetical protein